MNDGQKLAIGAGVVLTAVGVVLATRKAEAAPPPPGAATIYGYVVDGLTGESISGAALGLSNGMSTVSDNNGDFVFPDSMAPGDYVLHATAVGYEGFTDNIHLVEGSNHLSVEMTPAPPGEVGVQFISNPSGATVSINNTPIGNTPVTKTFALGTYSVKFSLAGYEDYIVTMVLDGSYDSTTVGAVMTPIPPPATPTLTLEIDSVERWAPPGQVWNFPHVMGRVSNHDTQPIVGRQVYLFRRYISTSSGLPIVHQNWLGEPLRIYNVPQSEAYPSFTLSPGQEQVINFIGQLDLPRDRICDVWLQDAVTGEKSNVFSV